jgi:DNA replication and repair protein RecF
VEKVGKTNVLDAIYHLSYGKSYFNPLAVKTSNTVKSFFVIDGVYKK